MKILVADDNPVNQKLIFYSLKRMYDVITAENGQEVLNIIQSHPIDLILMDLAMPVMDGAEATQKIRMMEQGGCKHIPIIFVTTSDIEKDRQRCLDLGADAYLNKPISTELLLSTLKRYLPIE